MSEEHMVMAGRLLAAVLAGGLIGLERGFRGRPAAAMRCDAIHGGDPGGTQPAVLPATSSIGFTLWIG